jgi:uracil-DNA glycosylase
VWGEGPSDPVGILIGEGPGPTEHEEGRPFVGVTGTQLSDELTNVGLRRSRLFILNATLCKPNGQKGERLMQQAVTACRPAFLDQLKDMPDVPMFAMGKWAAFAVMFKKTKGILKTRGFIRDVEVPRFWTTKGKHAVQSTDVPSKKRSRRT